MHGERCEGVVGISCHIFHGCGSVLSPLSPEDVAALGIIDVVWYPQFLTRLRIATEMDNWSTQDVPWFAPGSRKSVLCRRGCVERSEALLGTFGPRVPTWGMNVRPPLQPWERAREPPGGVPRRSLPHSGRVPP